MIQMLQVSGSRWYFDSQMVEGPNWKIAYDGYLDIYHLPILHKETFGSNFPHRANYYPFGPHQRVSGPNHLYSITNNSKMNGRLMH